MNDSGEFEQVGREAALAEMRRLAVLDVNRILRDVETRKQGLVRVIKARSISIASGYVARIKDGLEEASVSAETIGDTDFPVVLRAVAKSFTELEEMIPQGVGRDVSDKDVEELSALAAGISVPSVYEPKFSSEPPAAIESLVEPESEVSHVEVRATEIPAAVLEKTETKPPVSVASLQSVEIPLENPKSNDTTQPVVGAVSKPANVQFSDSTDSTDSTGLGGTQEQEDDNLPPEAAKFAHTSRVERVRRISKRGDEDNGGPKDGPKNKTPFTPKLKPTLGVRRNDPRGHEFTNGVDIGAASKKSGSSESQEIGAKSSDVTSDSKGTSQERPRQQERSNGEKESDTLNLEQIVAEVKDVIASGEGDNLVLVPKEDAEVRIRRMAREFGSINFNKRPPEEREREIVLAVKSFTSNEILRADLEAVFRKMARVSGGDKVLPAESQSEPTKGVSQYPKAIGPQVPREGVVQYDKPIGPKLPRVGVSQYPEPIGPKAPLEGVNQYDEPIGPTLPTQSSIPETGQDLSGQTATVEKITLPNPFSFSDLGILRKEDWSEVLKGIDSLTLATACLPLKGRTDITDRIVEALPPKILAELTEYIIKNLSDIDPKNIAAAESRILSNVNALITKGDIVLDKPLSPEPQPVFNAGVSQYPEPIGPKLPTESVRQYDEPIGPIPSPESPKKETKRQKQDRLARELRREVFADKRENMKKSQSGSGGGKPPTKPPEVAVGVPAEGEPNRDTLELDGTETADVLARKIRSLKTVLFKGRQFEGQVVAELIENNLEYMGTAEFRKLSIGEKTILVGAFVRDLKTIDPKIAELPFVRQLEEAVALGTPKEIKETEGLSLIQNAENEPRVDSPKDVLPENAEETSLSRPARPSVPEAQEVPVKMIASPSEALVKAVLEDPNGFDIGRALDVPGFDEFLAEGEKMGVVIDMADSASLKKRFEAFAFKDAAAAGTYELYADSISKDLRLSLDEEGKQAVREHLERQAHVNPESIKNLVAKFERFKDLPSQTEAFEVKINELKQTLSPEAQERARQPLEEKREALQMALQTNRFWPRWSREKGFTGLGWLHVRGEKAAARSEAAKEARSSGLELWATFGFGLSTKELRVGLQRVEEQLADLERQAGTAEAGKLKIAELEAMGQQAKRDLENAKVYLFQDSILTKKLVGMARVKVREKISSSVFLGEETVETAVEANELFERAIKASSGNHFGDDDGDYLEGVDVPTYRKWIDEALDRGIEKEIEKSIVRSMALSLGRFGELQKAFDRLTSNERLGSKSRAEVRKFIVKKLKKEIELVAGLNRDESTEDGKKRATETKLKNLHLMALVVKQQEALVLNK